MTDSKTYQGNTKIIAAIILTACILMGILIYAILTTAGIITTPESPQPAAYISIDRPVEGENLDLTWFINIRGQAGGLSGSGLVIQALDSAGNLLAQANAVRISPEANDADQWSWSADLRIDAPIGSQGQIVAYSPSPVNGSWLAEDRINVGFGESPYVQELVSIEDHFWALASLNERPPTADLLLTLQFERFQAVGFGGCNNFHTSFERNGNNLNFGFVTSTAKECELPPGVLVQEAAYFDALEAISMYQIEDSKLTMFDNSGAERLVYDAVVLGTIQGNNTGPLPESGIVKVKLIDTTLTNPEKAIIAEQEIQEYTQLPLPYVLVYNPKQININLSYAMVVQIEDSSGNLVFTSPAPQPVFTDGYPALIDIRVENNGE